MTFRFEGFVLDPPNRRLWQGGVPVELNARYLDALVLLVREQGDLVSKDHFLEEVWRGVPVTDEALTQCIKTLRRQLGDDAANPRFIETVPKHGYRFVAQVEFAPAEPGGAAHLTPALPKPSSWLPQILLLGGAGSIGGAAAGLVGGLLYGFMAASQPAEQATGAASALVVIVCITFAVALVGAAGVAFGIAAASLFSGRAGPWSVLGGAAGGLLIGAAVKLVGIDAFNLLLGRSPGDITGAPEGALLGAAVGLGAWLSSRAAQPVSLARGIALTGLLCAVAGALIPALGGTLMAGSLDLLARSFPSSHLRLDAIGRLLGESQFGPVSQVVTGALEAALFGMGIVGAMLFARRHSEPVD